MRTGRDRGLVSMPEPLITESDRIDALISPFEQHFPSAADFKGYRNHCLRMLNVILALSEVEPDRREKAEIALAFHDITVFPDRTLDYLGQAAALACEHLQSIGRSEWESPVTLMITQHHKVRPYSGPHHNLVEAMRKADWVDVSFGRMRFGLPRDWLRQLHETLPLYSFYPKTLFPLIGRYMLRHPSKPLPNFRW